MEIKNYENITDDIVKANELLSRANSAKNKEVNTVTGNVMDKMGAWFFETCRCCTEFEPKRPFVFQSNIGGYGKLNRNAPIELCFTQDCGGGLTIDITETARFKVGVGSSGFSYAVFGKHNLDYGKGRFFHKSSNHSYWHDEKTIAAIVKVWPEIKSKIEEHVEEIINNAKNEAIKKAAEIEESLRIVESLKNFEV